MTDRAEPGDPPRELPGSGGILGCSHPDCALPAWCSYCGGACILHCVGVTSYWKSLRYFWRVWRDYVTRRLV